MRKSTAVWLANTPRAGGSHLKSKAAALEQKQRRHTHASADGQCVVENWFVTVCNGRPRGASRARL